MALEVLIIDDEVIVGKALERAFRASGHNVRMTANPQQAVKMWEEQKPDVVMLDVIMPGLTGPQLLQELKQTGQGRLLTGVTVIFMSAHSTVKNRASAEELGGHAFFQKPFENIFEVVKRVSEIQKKV